MIMLRIDFFHELFHTISPAKAETGKSAKAHGHGRFPRHRVKVSAHN